MTDHDEKEPAGKRGRRAFLNGAGSLAAGTVVLGKLGTAEAAGPDTDGFVERVAALRAEVGASQKNRELKKRALWVRVEAAKNQYEKPIARHPANGDEQRYASKIGSDTRGLPHDQRGEVDPTAWQLAAQAYASRSWADWEKVPLGGTRKFVNPTGTLAASLEGANVTQFGIPAAPTLAGEARGRGRGAVLAGGAARRGLRPLRRQHAGAGSCA